ncbi:DUF397 domain-containing protein [Nocardia sp. NPDC057227]|uniref:DUF397 domain-containing protein n=1 Tax=Nocardia sp. NPDC057227 TaxID=3346056 RepID=UPI00362F7E91
MTANFRDARWFTSSRSGSRECIEVAFAGGEVGVRDSKNRGAGHLAFPADSWREFLASLRRDELK